MQPDTQSHKTGNFLFFFFPFFREFTERRVLQAGIEEMRGITVLMRRQFTTPLYSWRFSFLPINSTCRQAAAQPRLSITALLSQCVTGIRCALDTRGSADSLRHPGGVFLIFTKTFSRRCKESGEMQLHSRRPVCRVGPSLCRMGRECPNKVYTLFK